MIILSWLSDTYIFFYKICFNNSNIECWFSYIIHTSNIIKKSWIFKIQTYCFFYYTFGTQTEPQKNWKIKYLFQYENLCFCRSIFANFLPHENGNFTEETHNHGDLKKKKRIKDRYKSYYKEKEMRRRNLV